MRILIVNNAYMRFRMRILTMKNADMRFRIPRTHLGRKNAHMWLCIFILIMKTYTSSYNVAQSSHSV